MESLLWINGEWRKSSSYATFEVRNPHSLKVVTISSSASTDDCENAVQAAHKAQPTWEQLSGKIKRQILMRAADLLESEKYKSRIYETLKEETEARDSAVASLNIIGGAAICREAGSQATLIHGETFPSVAVPGAQVVMQRRAHGVILVIVPWNAPLALAMRSLAVPLVCGNTVIFKGSELSPRSHAIVVDIFHEAGLPAGVINFICSSRESSPALVAGLIKHPLVRHISFTGSDRVGSLIAAEAAKYLKPCVFELGGKAPVVVLDDADINNASRAIVFGAMMFSGQICMSTERVIVQRGVAEVLTQRIKSMVTELKAGATTALPPLISEFAAENVLNLLKEAKAEGADILLGDLKRDGATIQPHILTAVRPGMRAWDRESFGPVIVLSVVDTVDEAIDLANASTYSLIASIWSNDVYKAQQLAARIYAGKVNINGPTLSVEPGPSLGGLGGSSGYGRFDVEHYTVKRLITIFPQNLEPLPLVG